MANLILEAILGWSEGDAQREKTKSHAASHDNTTVIRHFNKLSF